MEAPFYQGINYRAGNPPYTPEKHGYKAGGGCGDHFIVEDLLDFSNEDEDATGDLDCGSFEAVAGNSTDSSTVTAVDCCSNNSISGADHHFNNDLDLSGDLCEPYDELAELEWLSNFAEESFSSEDLEKLQLISGLKASSATSPETRVSSTAAAAAAFRPDGPVPAKARSKRSRAAPCNWSSRLLVLSPPPIPSASSSSSDFIVPNSHKKLPKPSKKKDATIGAVMAPSEGRRCLHCATDKTPQWRTGPMGPKTLCNACGVRFKSGRLVPEYRPAASPTFMLSKHSNSHRKVLELRRQKEAVQHQQFLHPSIFDPAGDDLFNDFRQLI